MFYTQAPQTPPAAPRRSTWSRMGQLLRAIHPMCAPVAVGLAIPPVVLLIFLHASPAPNSAIAARRLERKTDSPPAPTLSADAAPPAAADDADPAELAAAVQQIAQAAVAEILHDPVSDGGEEYRQQQWSQWLDALRAVHRQRKADAAQRLEQINVAALTIVANADFDGFIEQATGLESKAHYVADPEAWRGWIKDLYCERLFPRAELDGLVAAHLQSLAPAQTALSEQVLVELGVDCELPASTSHVIRLDAASMDDAIDTAVGTIIPALETLMIEHVATFAASTAASQVAYDATRDSMADENGDVSLAGEAFAALFGLAADLAVTATVEEVSTTTDDLRHSLRQATDQLVASCLLSGPAGQRLISDVVDAIGHHDVALASALIDHLGVDRAWAVDAYLKHVVDRTAE